MTNDRDDHMTAGSQEAEGAAPAMPTMDELMAEYDAAEREQKLREGEVVKGIVIQISDHGVMVDVGTKSEGIIPRHEVEAIRDSIAVGDEIEVAVSRVEDEDGRVELSKQLADRERAWGQIVELQDRGEVLEAKVIEAVRGGLLVDLGLFGQGFVPASHVSIRRPRNLQRYVGETIKLVVIEVERRRKRVVLSHRKVMEDMRSGERDETLQTLQEGQVRRGVVRRITDFGAFVDIGGVDGLLHISEMSWQRIDHPGDDLKVNDTVDVMVLKLNLDEGRISLGRRQLLSDPWREIPKIYTEGSAVRARVTKLVDEGCVVRLPVGVDCFVALPDEMRPAAAEPVAAEPAAEAGEPEAVEVADLAVEVPEAADAPEVPEAVEATEEPAAEVVEAVEVAPDAEVAAEPAVAEAEPETEASAPADDKVVAVGAELDLRVDRISMVDREIELVLASSRVMESRATVARDADSAAPRARGRYRDRRDEDDDSASRYGEAGARPQRRRERDRDRDRDRDRGRDPQPAFEQQAAPAQTLGDLLGDKLRALREVVQGDEAKAAAEEESAESAEN